VKQKGFALHSYTRLKVARSLDLTAAGLLMQTTELTFVDTVVKTGRTLLYPIGHTGLELHLLVRTSLTKLSFIACIDIEAFYPNANFFFVLVRIEHPECW